MKSFLVALQFLTILPINISAKVEDKDFGKSLSWFPFVGALIGLALSLITFLSGLLPQPVIAALILAGSLIVSGGIHLDGFADTCDGLYEFTTREKALEIMRDSRIGTMAAAAVIILLILKFSILSGLHQANIWKYLILMAAFARWAQVLACFLSRYARQEGKAKYFIEYAGLREITTTSIFIALLFMLLLGGKGLILLLTCLSITLILINYIKSKLGGMTGDTIGAISEVAEAGVLLFGLIFLRIGL